MMITKRFLKGFGRDERGVTLVEYGIAIALAIAVGSATFLVLSGEINSSLNTVGAQMP